MLKSLAGVYFRGKVLMVGHETNKGNFQGILENEYNIYAMQF